MTDLNKKPINISEESDSLLDEYIDFTDQMANRQEEEVELLKEELAELDDFEKSL